MNAKRKPVTRVCSAVRLLAGLAFTVVTCAVYALPVELTRAQFTTQAAGLTTVVEDFESFATGVQPNPMTLANGIHTSTLPSISNSALFCGDVDRCLIDSATGTAPRSFHAFPVGTIYWATDFHALQSAALFDVMVVGGSGTAIFTHASVGGFWGFHDSAGLTSVEFLNLGTANYSFDNVTTAATATALSEPGSLPLLGIILAGLAWKRGKRSCDRDTTRRRIRSTGRSR